MRVMKGSEMSSLGDSWKLMEIDPADWWNEFDPAHLTPVYSEDFDEADGSRHSGPKSTSFGKMKARTHPKPSSIRNLTLSWGNLAARSSFIICKNLYWMRHRFEDFAPSCFFGIICFASSQVFLVNLRCSLYLYDYLLFHLRVGIINAFSKLNPENISIEIYGSIGRSHNVGNLLIALVCVHLRGLYSNMWLMRRLASPEVIMMREADYNSSLPVTSRASHPTVSKNRACNRNRKPMSRLADQTFVSCANGVSTYSNCQESSELSTNFSKGTLYVLSERGIPYFTFSVTDNEAYIAIPRNMNLATEGVHGYIFLFRTMPSSGRNLCDLVGIIKISSHVTSASYITKHTESEFVLYETRKIYPVGTESSTIRPKKSKVFPKLTLSAFRKNKTAKKSSEHISIGSQTYLKHCIDELKQFKGDLPDFLMKHLHPSLESAAVVIRDYHCDEEKMSKGGWGLKFLEKHVDAKVKLSEYLSIPLESCISGERGSARRIDVVIPSGQHCFQESGTARPSTLIERWKSGSCDCGGWDIGCPFYLLKSWVADTKAFSEEALQQDCGIVNLVKEGYRRRTSMRIETISENLHDVHFLQNLTSIQSFSIGLSMIHAQISSDCPYL